MHTHTSCANIDEELATDAIDVDRADVVIVVGICHCC